MRIAETAPPFCTACCNQDPMSMHVDLECAYDGPVVDIEGQRYVSEDVILCERCVRAAASFLPETQRDDSDLQELNERYVRLYAYASRLEKANAKLTDAIKVKPLADFTPRRKRAKQDVPAAA